jgi:hypothetical protein
MQEIWNSGKNLNIITLYWIGLGLHQQSSRLYSGYFDLTLELLWIIWKFVIFLWSQISWNLVFICDRTWSNINSTIIRTRMWKRTDSVTLSGLHALPLHIDITHTARTAAEVRRAILRPLYLGVDAHRLLTIVIIQPAAFLHDAVFAGMICPDRVTVYSLALFGAFAGLRRLVTDLWVSPTLLAIIVLTHCVIIEAIILGWKLNGKHQLNILRNWSKSRFCASHRKSKFYF